MSQTQRRRQTDEIAVHCDGCGHAMTVNSRSMFGIVEDLHRDACGIEGLSYEGTVDAVLELPPFE